MVLYVYVSKQSMTDSSYQHIVFIKVTAWIVGYTTPIF